MKKTTFLAAWILIGLGIISVDKAADSVRRAFDAGLTVVPNGHLYVAKRFDAELCMLHYSKIGFLPVLFVGTVDCADAMPDLERENFRYVRREMAQMRFMRDPYAPDVCYAMKPANPPIAVDCGLVAHLIEGERFCPVEGL